MLNQLKPHLKKPIGVCTIFFRKVDILSDFTREQLESKRETKRARLKKKKRNYTEIARKKRTLARTSETSDRQRENNRDK